MSGQAVARRWAPPRLDAETASLINVLAARRKLPDFQDQAVWTEPPGPVVEAAEIGFTLGGAPACALVPPALLRRLLDGLDLAASSAQGEWRGLLLELALQDMLDQLERVAPFLAIRPIETPPMGEDCVTMGVAVGADRLRVTLSADAARLAASALERIPPARTRLPGLTITVSLRAMATTLPLDALRRLVAGDVVLADGLADGAVLAVAGERIAWHAVRSGTQLRVTSVARRAASAGWKDWLMMEDDEAEGALAEVPVRLVFELGRLELTLAELEAIGPGHVFDLARQEAEAVDIVANGRRIGRGRIVDVAGVLGVQVVRIER